ncbi:MAG: VanZ family protein [Bacteroidetes bacterium]|nr:VanZ family protein [Bacteroidota bacterium]
MENSKKIIRIIPALLWSGIIFFLCFLPGSSFPKEDWLDKIYFDKLVHCFLYFVLFLLFLRGFLQQNKKAFFIAAGLCIAQGIFIEIIQGSSLIQHRSFDFYDIAANIFGVFLAILFKCNVHKTN